MLREHINNDQQERKEDIGLPIASKDGVRLAGEEGGNGTSIRNSDVQGLNTLPKKEARFWHLSLVQEATMADQTLSILTNVLASTPSLSAHLDEDTSEYILSILLDNPNNEDARDAVPAFFQGHDVNEAVCAQFFATLDASSALNNADGRHGGSKGMINLSIHEQAAEVPFCRLNNAITLQSWDIVTFAWGLVPDTDSLGLRDGGNNTDGAPSDIQSFYANMIDASDIPRATSEREKRKARQRELRERSDEEEQRRAIKDATRMMDEEGGQQRAVRAAPLTAVQG